MALTSELLFDRGRRWADIWLAEHYDSLGHASTFDVDRWLSRPGAERPRRPTSPPPLTDLPHAVAARHPRRPCAPSAGALLRAAMNEPEHQRLLIVDFGSQVTQLIARRLREARIYCEIHPYQKVDAAFLADFRPQAVILSGGPASVTDAGSPRAAPEIFTLGVPVLGICYGQQTMMAQLGGKVEGRPPRRVRPRLRHPDRDAATRSSPACSRPAARRSG